MEKSARKLMSNIICFLDKLDQDCNLNHTNLKELSLKVLPFNVNWDDIKWDITSAVEHKIRGHNNRNKYLNFNQNVPNNYSSMFSPLVDVIKALTILRFSYGGQGPDNLQRFIDGWKYIHDELTDSDFRLELITVEVLNNACRTASNRLAQSTAYNIHKSIHEIADLIDINKLAKVHLGFRYSGLKRPSITGGVNYRRLDSVDLMEETFSDKMVSEKVLEAIGKLYQKIPREDQAYRVRILLVVIAIFTGRRIGEILTMPALPVQKNSKNTAYITIYPQKKSLGDAIYTKQHVPLASASIELIESVLNELLELTASIREVAEYIHEHQHADYRVLDSYRVVGYMTSKDIEQCFNLSAKNGKQWAIGRKLVNNGSNQCWNIDQVEKGLDSDVNLKPVLVSNGQKVYLKDCMAILPMNAVHSLKTTFNYAVRLITIQQMSDFLGNNNSRRYGKESYKKKGKVFSVFDKYFSAEEAGFHSTNTHAFRHTLNTLLDEGGMSDLAQTSFFGRINPKDTKTYQHTSPAKAALIFRDDLLKGKISGPIAEQLMKIPLSIHQAYLNAKIKVVFDIGIGSCTHDLAQDPCIRHLQCSAKCDDFHWRKDASGKLDDLKRQFAMTMQSLKFVQNKAKEMQGEPLEYLIHIGKKVHTLTEQLKDAGIENFDYENYLLSEIEDEKNKNN